jgi:transcriptional regulator with XRE-family HTH domain
MDGSKVRALLKIADANEKWLAFRVGCTPGHINNLIAGRKHPSFAMACRLADALGVTVDELRKKKKGGKHASTNMRGRKRNPV